MAQIVYTGTGMTDAAVVGTLFHGQRFWISQRVPFRKRFIEQVAVNGGKLVDLERDADIKIVDHARKDVIPGSYSWTYIDQSVRKGVLESLADHQAGPPSGTVRSVSSLNQSTKGSRTPFTAEDDRILYAWVQECEQRGMKVAGNEIYKQLEQKNPRHTFQSWRDRYHKYLSLKLHPAQVPANAPPIPPLDQRLPKKTHLEKQYRKPSPNAFGEEDEETILDRASDIENIDLDNSNGAWQAWAKEYPHHSAEEWQEFWEKHVRPRYLQKAQNRSTGMKRKLEELLDAQLGHEVDDQRSTSFQSESTRISCRLKSHDELDSDYVEHRANLNVSRPSSNTDNVQPIPSIEAISHSIRPSEQKKTTYKTEIPSSSPLQPVAAAKTRKRSHPYRNPFTDPESVSSDIDSIEELEGPSTPLKRVINNQQDNEFTRIGNSTLKVQGSPSLSEPERHQTHVGARRNEPYVDLGLDVASPEGGWNLDGEQNEEDRIGKGESRSRDATAEDTQDLLNAKTQIPDFSVADPDGGWDGALFPSSPPPLTTLLRAASDPDTNVVDEIDEEEANAQFMEWITDHLTADVPVEDVEVALKSTGNNLDLAEIVLESLAENRGVPQNLRGVWTVDDDDNLYARDGRKIEQLQRKHGVTEFDERYKFLAKHERL